MIYLTPMWILIGTGFFTISMVLSFFGDCTGNGNLSRHVLMSLFVVFVFVALDYFDVGIAIMSKLVL